MDTKLIILSSAGQRGGAAVKAYSSSQASSLLSSSVSRNTAGNDDGRKRNVICLFPSTCDGGLLSTTGSCNELEQLLFPSVSSTGLFIDTHVNKPSGAVLVAEDQPYSLQCVLSYDVSSFSIWCDRSQPMSRCDTRFSSLDTCLANACKLRSFSAEHRRCSCWSYHWRCVAGGC